MNAAVRHSFPGVREAMLGDAREAAALDAFVREHPHGTPFHLTGWSRAVEAGCRQRARFLIAGQGARIEGVLPLTEIASPLFGRALVSTGFAVGGGILAAGPQTELMLADAARDLAGRLGCPLELRGGPAPGEGWVIDDATYAGFSRRLAEDDDAELKAIPRKQRAEVRRALGFDLNIEAGRSARERAVHYAVYAESVRNLGTPVFPRSLFDHVLNEFMEDSDILTISQNGVPISSVLSFYYRGSVMPYWGGGTRSARGWRANDLLYFALMRHARARGCTRFDFGRSKVGTGAYAFKKNWGFDPVQLRYATLGPGRSINPLDPRYRFQVALWKHMPLAVANRIGPIIARGLG